MGSVCSPRRRHGGEVRQGDAPRGHRADRALACSGCGIVRVRVRVRVRIKRRLPRTRTKRRLPRASSN
eukprot:scaffold24463_cov50-Phaeocystis_antarctica.AAC.2